MFAIYQEGPKIKRRMVGVAASPEGVKAGLKKLAADWQGSKHGRVFVIDGIEGLAKWSNGAVAFTVEADPVLPEAPAQVKH